MKFYVKLNRKSKVNVINKDYLLIGNTRLKTNGIIDSKANILSIYYNYCLFMNQSLFIFMKTQEEPLSCFNVNNGNNGNDSLLNIIFNDFFKSTGTITLTNLDTFEKNIMAFTKNEFNKLNHHANKVREIVNRNSNIYFMELEALNKRTGFIFVNYPNFLNKFTFEFIKKAVLNKENIRGFENKNINLFLDLTFTNDLTPEMVDFLKKINPAIMPVRPAPKVPLSIKVPKTPPLVKPVELFSPPLKGLTPDFFDKIDKTLGEIRGTFLGNNMETSIFKREIYPKINPKLLQNELKDITYNHFKEIVKIQSELEKDNCNVEQLYQKLIDELNFTKVSVVKLKI